MNQNSRYTCLFALAILAILGVSVAWTQVPKTQKGVELEIERVQKRLEEEKASWAEESTKELQSAKNRKRRYQLAREDVEKNTKRVYQLEQDIAEAALQLESEEAEYKALEQEMTQLGISLMPHIKRLEKALGTGFPHEKKKRLEKIQLLISDMKKEKVSPEEAFSRLWQIYQSESQLAASAEIFSGDVQDVSGRTRAVKFLRVGKQVLAYADGTGDLVGIQRQLDNGRWEWIRQDELNYKERQSIRNAVAVGEGKETPGFVVVPFWIGPKEKEL